MNISVHGESSIIASDTSECCSSDTPCTSQRGVITRGVHVKAHFLDCLLLGCIYSTIGKGD